MAAYYTPDQRRELYDLIEKAMKRVLSRDPECDTTYEEFRDDMTTLLSTCLGMDQEDAHIDIESMKSRVSNKARIIKDK